MKPLLLLFALLSASVFAEPAKPAPKPFSLPAGIKMEKDIAYIADGDEAQKLDLYLPEKSADKPLPLIVHIHGGGWRGGSKFPCPVAGMVLKGYAVASVEYRFSQKAVFPAQIQDCQAAGAQQGIQLRHGTPRCCGRLRRRASLRSRRHRR